MSESERPEPERPEPERPEPERPEPEYGEYASPEEYAAALARSGAGSNSSSPTTEPPDGIAKPIRLAKPPSAAFLSAQVSPRAALDRMVTIFLLSFGAVSVLGNAGGLLNLRMKLPELVSQLGMGEFHSTAQTATMGIIMFASQVLLWGVAALWSFRRIRRQKLSWWVPVLLGAIGFVLLSILLGLALSADPTFLPKF